MPASRIAGPWVRVAIAAFIAISLVMAASAYSFITAEGTSGSGTQPNASTPAQPPLSPTQQGEEDVDEDIDNWVRGVHINPTWSEFYAYSEFREAVDRIAATNANYIGMGIRHVQSSLQSSDVQPSADLTPTDESLIDGIRYAHSQCLRVALVPGMRVAEDDTIWQARIDPDDREEWFRNYGEILLHYAEIAEEEGVGMIYVASELSTLTSDDAHPDNTRLWRELIADIREVYSGELTYQAQWDPRRLNARHVEFWDDLDYIGIAAFFDLPSNTNEVNDIMEEWDRWERDYIRPLRERWDMPILFAEVGYRNQEGARFQPWGNPSADNSEQEQANLYEALMSYWSQIDYFDGMFWWEWFPSMEEGNTYYTPHDKQAEDVLGEWFGRAAPIGQDAESCPEGHAPETDSAADSAPSPAPSE